MTLGLSRARDISDLGYTAIVAMQLPYQEVVDRYLDTDVDKVIKLTNVGENKKSHIPQPNNAQWADYPQYDFNYETFDIEHFANQHIPKVLVPARFQVFHKGHDIVIATARRLSPDVTICLRADEGNQIDLEFTLDAVEKITGHKVIESPGINDDWTDFANQYDCYVQGNPMVIAKFEKSDCKHIHVPRYGDISTTKIRANIHEFEKQMPTYSYEIFKKHFE